MLRAGDFLQALNAAGRGDGERVVAQAYECACDRAAEQRLTDLCREIWGTLTQVTFRPPLAYGEEDDFLQSARAGDLPAGDHFLLLMSFTAVPEDENQGVLVDGLTQLISQNGLYRQLLVMLDATEFRRRMGEAVFKERRPDRERAWTRLLAPHGVEYRAVGAARQGGRRAARRLAAAGGGDVKLANPWKARDHRLV